MNTKRIEEIQKETAYPDSISVQHALYRVWKECEQEKVEKNNAVLQLVIRSLPSYEEMQPVVERIAYEQLAAEQIDDLVAKMNLLRQFIERMVISGNDV